MSLDLFQRTPLGRGNIQQAARRQLSGIEFGSPSIYFDGNDATDSLENPNNPHPFVVGERVWLQADPGGAPISYSAPRDKFVKTATPDAIQLSDTPNGPALPVAAGSRVVVSRLLVDFRESEGREILYAMKTNLQGDLTDEETDEITETIERILIGAKRRVDGE